MLPRRSMYLVKVRTVNEGGGRNSPKESLERESLELR